MAATIESSMVNLLRKRFIALASKIIRIVVRVSYAIVCLAKIICALNIDFDVNKETFSNVRVGERTTKHESAKKSCT